MSTIKSSAENLTLNADGANNDIKFQSNGSEVASIDQAGSLVLNGNLTSLGIDDNATSNAITIDNSGNVGIGNAAYADPRLTIHSAAGGDPQLVFDGSASSRSGLIKFYDNGSTTGGFIDYLHNGDKMNFGAGSSVGVNFRVCDGYVNVVNGMTFGTDTAAANTLDDYEEGTWSPSLIGATFDGQTTTGRYVKIGNIVHIQYYTAAFNISSASGAARIGNLPYAPLNVSGNHSVISYTHGTAVIGASNIFIDHSNATMYFVTNDSTSSPSWTNGNSKYVMLSGTYQTA